MFGACIFHLQIKPRSQVCPFYSTSGFLHISMLAIIYENLFANLFLYINVVISGCFAFYCC